MDKNKHEKGNKRNKTVLNERKQTDLGQRKRGKKKYKATVEKKEEKG